MPVRILLQDGYGKDLLILAVIAILAATGLALAGGRAADAYLARAVDETLGSTGTYDAILHFRSESADSALPQAEALLARAHPGIRLHRGVQVAGNANLFVSLPDGALNREGLEGLPALVRQVPGYNGVTYMVEPSVELANVAGGLEQAMTARVEQIPGVAFAFRRGGTITAVLEGPDRLAAVSRELQRLAGEQRLVELRLPQAATLDPQHVADRLSESTGLAIQPVTGSEGPSAETASALKQLKELLPLLREDSGLKAALQQAAQQVRELGEAVGQSQEAAREAVTAGSESAAQLQAALLQVESLKARVDQLSQELASPSGRGAALDLLARLVVENLAGARAQAGPSAGQEESSPRPDEEALAAVEGLTPEALTGLQGDLEELSEALNAVDPASLAEAADQLEAAAASLPALTGGELGAIHSLLETAGQATRAEGRYTFLVPGGADARELTRVARVELGDPEATAVISPSATVRPTPRASLMQILHQTRGLVAGILVVVLVGAHLVLDLSALRSGSALLRRLRPGLPPAAMSGGAGNAWSSRLRRFIARWVRRADLSWFLAAAWGGLVLMAAYTLSGARLPYIDAKAAALMGALLALASWALAGRINPLRAEEVELAVAAGLTPAQVMRAVVLPEARPTLLALVGRRGRLLEGPGRRGKGAAATAVRRWLGRGRSA